MELKIKPTLTIVTEDKKYCSEHCPYNSEPVTGTCGCDLFGCSCRYNNSKMLQLRCKACKQSEEKKYKR